MLDLHAKIVGGGFYLQKDLAMNKIHLLPEGYQKI